MTPALRRVLRALALHSPARPLASLAHRLTIAAELAGIRAFDPGLDSRETRVTALVKTFERPYACTRLLASLRRHYPELPVVVVDDSREPRTRPDVVNVHLPFATGIGVGRNAGLERVETPFVVNLDDDFVFFSGTRLSPVLDLLENEPAVDLVGGDVTCLPLFRTADYSRIGLPAPCFREPVRPLGSRIGGLPVVDKVPNFFVARTGPLRELGWEPRVRRLDHAYFFFRARGRLTTVYDRRLRALHARTPFDRHYAEQCIDPAEDQRRLALEYRKHRLLLDPWPPEVLEALAEWRRGRPPGRSVPRRKSAPDGDVRSPSGSLVAAPASRAAGGY